MPQGWRWLKAARVYLETGKPPETWKGEALNIRFKISFLIRELTGALGDLPLFFIFFAGLTQFSDLNPLNILFWSGLAHIVVGIVFRVPLPYQPMKAMGLFAIAHGVSQAELLSAGVGIGLLILAMNSLGLFQKLYDFFPKAVIRGIQLGLALMLCKKAVELVLIDGSFYFMFAGGAVDFPSVSWPRDFFHLASLTWTETVLTLIVIQLPLTMANSIFSPTLLLRDYFPNRKIKASQIAASVGWMNLLTCLFGGMPACHGAGGLAAQYRFGARSGLSVIFLGFLKIVMALFLGGFFMAVARHFPRGLLGLLLLFPAHDLIWRAAAVRGGVERTVVGVTALTMVFWHAGWAMVVGGMLFYMFHYLRKVRVS